MNKFKHLLIIGLFGFMVLFNCAMPALAKSNQSDWTFNFDLQGCIGKNNNKYHTLAAGDVEIVGKWYFGYSEYERGGDLYLELKKVGLLWDKNYGAQNVGYASTSSMGFIDAYYTVDEYSDKYYLKWVCYADFVDKIGEGIIYNR